MKSWIVRVIMVLAPLVVVGALVLHFYDHRPPQVTDTAPPLSQTSDSAPSRNLTFGKHTASASEESEGQADGESANPLHVPREKIEEYLKLHKRDGASLLAAFHAASDPEHP